jgi:hypothetical protein
MPPLPRYMTTKYQVPSFQVRSGQMVTLKCLIGVSGQIQVRSVPDLIGRSGQSGQVNLTCRAGPENRHINHGKLKEGFCKTATVRTIAFRGQLIANHCSFLVCTRVSTLRTIAVSCAYQNPQKFAHTRNTLETPCRPKQWGAVPDLGWVSSARVLQLRARHRT